MVEIATATDVAISTVRFGVCENKFGAYDLVNDDQYDLYDQYDQYDPSILMEENISVSLPN